VNPLRRRPLLVHAVDQKQGFCAGGSVDRQVDDAAMHELSEEQGSWRSPKRDLLFCRHGTRLKARRPFAIGVAVRRVLSIA
jgi:hypothetical protein